MTDDDESVHSYLTVAASTSRAATNCVSSFVIRRSCVLRHSSFALVLCSSRRPCTVVLVLALVVLAGCKRSSDSQTNAVSGLRPVTLALNWFPEAEHGGFFAADVHGYFRDEGLDVEILSGGPGAPVIQQVATGRCTLAVANADQVLLGRDQGLRSWPSWPRCRTARTASWCTRPRASTVC